jgi:diguanylate cyclase (GGDEF)-like protein/PAS domain S-box-containing protein
MSIKQRSLIIFISSILITILILETGALTILKQSYKQVDIESAKMASQRVQSYLRNRNNILKNTSIDWAYWDATYQFIRDKNTQYVEDNLNDAALSNVDLDIIVFIDNARQIVYYKDNKRDNDPDISSDNIASLINSNPSLIKTESGYWSSEGVISVNNVPLYLVASPILKNDYSGPSDGVLVIGRFLNNQFIDQVSSDLGYSILINPVIQDSRGALNQNTSPIPNNSSINTWVEELNSQTLGGYSYISDPQKTPKFKLEVIVPRLYYSQGKAVSNYLLILMTILGVICLGIVYYILQQLFFNRLGKLLQDVIKIINQPEPNARLAPDSRKDEISTLSASINTLLDSMQAIQGDYKTLIDNQSEGVVIIDKANVIRFCNRAANNILESEQSQLLGHPFEEFLSDKKQFIQNTKVEELLKGSTCFEISIRSQQSYIKTGEISASARYDRHNEFIGALLILRDITDQKRSEVELLESEKKLRSLIEQSTVGIFMADANGNIIEWNPKIESILGLRKESILNQNFENVIKHLFPQTALGENGVRHYQEQYKSFIKGDYSVINNHPSQFSFPASDNVTKYIEISLFPIQTDSVNRIGGIIIDITEQKRMEEEERKQRIFIEALRDTSEVLNSTLDFDSLMERILINADRVIPSDSGAILLLENGMLRIVQSRGYEERGYKDVTATLPFPLENMRNMAEMAKSGQPIAIPDTREYEGWNPIRENKWVMSYIGVPLCIRDRIIGFLSLFKGDPGFYTEEYIERLKAFANQTAIAIENARLYSELQHKADTDELTGLRNRRSLFELGGREVERANRFSHPLSALMIDLDYFKTVNDSFGHPVGDRLLITLADQFRKSLRNVDLVARYGGDEFVALLPENDLDSAMEVAKRLQKAIESTWVETAQGKAKVSASIGVASLNPSVKNLSSLIESADRALYHAKQYGRSRIVSSLQE